MFCWSRVNWLSGQCSATIFGRERPCCAGREWSDENDVFISEVLSWCSHLVLQQWYVQLEIPEKKNMGRCWNPLLHSSARFSGSYEDEHMEITQMRPKNWLWIYSHWKIEVRFRECHVTLIAMPWNDCLSKVFFQYWERCPRWRPNLPFVSIGDFHAPERAPFKSVLALYKCPNGKECFV